MVKVLDFNKALEAKKAEENAFKARQWGDIYSDALGMGFSMDQAMDIADNVTDDMWKAGLGQGDLTVTFEQEH